MTMFPQQGTCSLHGTPRNLSAMWEFTSCVSSCVQLHCITRRELHYSEVRSWATETQNPQRQL